MIEAFKIISQEISDMTLASAFNMTIFIAFAWFISKFAKNTIPRLLWIGLGIYFIFPLKDTGKILYDIDTLIGIGIILPHIFFFIEWIKEIYYEFKRVTIDTYVFAITIYYKVRNFFLWFYDTYKKIHNFFTIKQNSKQEQKDYYQEQQKQDYGSYKQDSKFYEKAKQRKEQRQQEEGSTYSQEEQYQEQEYEDTSSSYEEAEVQQELSLEEELMQDDRYKHFFSDSAYTVLGVSINDEFKTMKKRFRKLASEFHPDRNYEEFDKYNILFARISSAYQTVEKFHK